MHEPSDLREIFLKLSQDWGAPFGPGGAMPHIPQYGDIYLDTSQAMAPIYQSLPISIGAWSAPSWIMHKLAPQSYRDAFRAINATRALPLPGTAGLKPGAEVAQFVGQRTGPSWFNRNIRQALSPRYRASMERGLGMLSTESGAATAGRMAKAMRGMGTIGTAVGAPLAILAEDALNKPKREQAAIQQAKAITDTNPFIRMKGASMDIEKTAASDGYDLKGNTAQAMDRIRSMGLEKQFYEWSKAQPSSLGSHNAIRFLEERDPNFSYKKTAQGMSWRNFAALAAVASAVGIGMQELVRNIRIAGDRAAYNVQTKRHWKKLLEAYPELESDPNNYEIFKGISEIAPSVARHPSLTINLIRNAQNYATTGMDPGTLRTLADIQSAITDTELKELNKGIAPSSTSMMPIPALQIRGTLER